MAKENSDSVLKTRELDIKEAKLALDAYVEGASNLMNKEEKAKDRQLKQTQEALKILSDLAKDNNNENLQKGKAVIEMVEAQMKEENKLILEQMKQKGE